ncbi:sce7726 family protein [Nocardioides ultimimeridianus]
MRDAMAVAIARQMGDRRHVLLHEVDVRWSIPARLDALLLSSRIHGFEIKSDVDSLSRLPRQVASYGMVVERATLIVGDRLRAAATEIVPPWWNIWSARWAGDKVRVQQVRGGRLNPAISPLAVTSFLLREDLLSALRERGHRRLSGVPVDDLRLRFASEFGSKQTVQRVREALLANHDRRVPSALPWDIAGAQAVPARRRGRWRRKLRLHDGEMMFRGDLTPLPCVALLVGACRDRVEPLIGLAEVWR